jgi:hypothetical protein
MEDTAIKTAHPLAIETSYDTLLAGQSYATPEATRRLTMLKADRILLMATIRADAVTVGLLDLGVVVSVQINRFGLNAGRLMTIIRIEADYERNQLNLRLWG